MKKSKNKKNSLAQDKIITKEGFMEKRTGLMKLWKSRYFVLLDDVLCYFLREEEKEYLTPTGRIFFSDIESMDRTEKKGHPFSMFVKTDQKKHVMSCSSYAEREDWMNRIWEAKEKHKSDEKHDPVRRRSSRLGKDFKRVTIKKDPQHGIGCTIKNVGGAIFVSRIIPDGPVATSGVLRPGDQIIDINGNRVSECPIEKIKDVIRSSPDYVVCTVKPVTHYNHHDASPQVGKTPYIKVDPVLLQNRDNHGVNTGEPMSCFNVGAYAKDLQQQQQQQETRNDEQPNYRDTQVVDHEHEKVSKKPTNYAELEFGVKT